MEHRDRGDAYSVGGRNVLVFKILQMCTVLMQPFKGRIRAISFPNTLPFSLPKMYLSPKRSSTGGQAHNTWEYTKPAKC
jgi:hypothetical protein